MHSIYQKIEEIKAEGRPAVLCIVIASSGSTPRKAGSKMLVFADGTVWGTIGGGSVEKDVQVKALEMMAGGKPQKFAFHLEEDLKMHCGGEMEVYLEPICQSQNLYIFGGGHIGRALSKMAADLNFSVTIIDPRPELFIEGFPGCKIMNIDYFEAIDQIPFDKQSYLVIVTPKHSYDEDILARVVRKPHHYIGMIGSGRKIALLRKRFLDENLLTKEELDTVDMPIGIKMNAETPQEIAVSILAKLIDVRNSE
jgi:xanthine dehydrogenase accessory factor